MNCRKAASCKSHVNLLRRQLISRRWPTSAPTGTLDAAVWTLAKSLDAAVQGAAAQRRNIIDIARKNLNLGFDLAKSLADANTLSEIVELQAAYWLKQFDALPPKRRKSANGCSSLVRRSQRQSRRRRAPSTKSPPRRHLLWKPDSASRAMPLRPTISKIDGKMLVRVTQRCDLAVLHLYKAAKIISLDCKAMDRRYGIKHPAFQLAIRGKVAHLAPAIF